MSTDVDMVVKTDILSHLYFQIFILVRKHWRCYELMMLSWKYLSVECELTNISLFSLIINRTNSTILWIMCSDIKGNRQALVWSMTLLLSREPIGEKALIVWLSSQLEEPEREAETTVSKVFYFQIWLKKKKKNSWFCIIHGSFLSTWHNCVTRHTFF